MVLYYTAKWVAIPNKVPVSHLRCYLLVLKRCLARLTRRRDAQFLGSLYYGLLVTLTFVVLFKSVWKQG